MPALSATDALLIARAERDFEEGLVHLKHSIREEYGRIGGAALEAIIAAAVATLQVRSRLKDDVKQLLALAHRVAAGEDPRPLAEEHIDRVLRLKQSMHLIAREDDPGFQHVRVLAQDLFARRLPDLARMASVEGARDYDDIVRRAFPDRAHVDALVDDNARIVEEIVAHLEKNPHILIVPRGLVPKIATMARREIAWKLGEVRRGVDEIYASA